MDAIEKFTEEFNEFTAPPSKFTAPVCIGIDPSLTCTGLAVLNGAVVALKSIKPNGKNIYEKCADVKCWVSHYILDATSGIFDDDRFCIAIETSFSGRNVETARKLASLGYAIRERLYKNGIPFVDVAPSQVKKFIGAKTKDQIMMQVLKRYKVETANSDEADAFVLAVIANCFMDPNKCANDKQREVIAKLRLTEGSGD